jgi:hypothetical protein
MLPKRYNIVLVQPPNVRSTGAFAEVVRLLHASLQSLGYPCDVSTNDIRKDHTNILIGYQLTAPNPVMRNFPVVIYQLEQLTRSNERFCDQWLEMLSLAQGVWDYSRSNIEFMEENGISGAKYLPIGYHPSLETIKPAPVEDIDVLFYGKATDRRKQILEPLSRLCKFFYVGGVWGAERDAVIARSKIVVNLRHGDADRFEQVRVSYLLNNGRCVVSEDSPDNPYPGMFAATTPQLLAPTCMEYLADEHRRHELAQRGASLFRAMRMEELLRKVIS